MYGWTLRERLAMHDSCRLHLEAIEREIHKLDERIADMERQVALVLNRVNLLPDPTMPHRTYPPNGNSAR